MNIGDKIMLIDVPECMSEDLFKVGIFKGYGIIDTNGERCVDILLDGEEGLTVCYERQLKKVL